MGDDASLSGHQESSVADRSFGCPSARRGKHETPRTAPITQTSATASGLGARRPGRQLAPGKFAALPWKHLQGLWTAPN